MLEYYSLFGRFFFVHSQSSTVVATMFYIMKGHSFVWIVSLRAFEGVFVLR